MLVSVFFHTFCRCNNFNQSKNVNFILFINKNPRNYRGSRFSVCLKGILNIDLGDVAYWGTMSLYLVTFLEIQWHFLNNNDEKLT